MKPPMHPAWSWFFLALVPFAAAGLAPRALAAEPDADAAPAATTPPRITAVPSAIDLVVNTVDGYVDIDVDNLPALPAASFVTSAVEQPEVFFEARPVDTTPDTPVTSSSATDAFTATTPRAGRAARSPTSNNGAVTFTFQVLL